MSLTLNEINAKYPGGIKNVIRKICLFVCLMVFNAPFNNISAISYISFICGGPGKNHQPVANH